MAVSAVPLLVALTVRHTSGLFGVWVCAFFLASLLVVAGLVVTVLGIRRRRAARGVDRARGRVGGRGWLAVVFAVLALAALLPLYLSALLYTPIPY